MKEIIELRINNTFSNLLPSSIAGKDIGPVTKIKIEKGSSEYQSIKELAEKVKAKNTESFFYGWGIKRSYGKKELANATLFHLFIANVFEPTGEECGTLYDEETAACEICGANRKQVSPLILKKGTIPKKDIARTIGGEVVVSEKFVNAVRQRNLKGLQLSTINGEKYYQLTADKEIELSPNTIVGINPFDLSTSSEGEIYKCPKGDTIGLNLLSEPYVTDSPLIKEFDFFASRQKIGVKRGLLRPEPIYFCSPAFRQMVVEEKLSGFEFEIANIDTTDVKISKKFS
jgi:hypothetical protein